MTTKTEDFYTPYPGDRARTLIWEVDEWLAGASIVDNKDALIRNLRNALAALVVYP